MRVGQGFDIHKLIENRKLIIGGVEIPFEKGLLGHSDADVLVHAIIDSLFGAINDGDIGEHFPDNDSNYKDSDSVNLLNKTGQILKQKGYKIINIDSTIICQKPKLLNFKEQMKKNISNALNIDIKQISIKAKTNEELDSVGRGEAISATAICLVDNI